MGRGAGPAFRHWPTLYRFLSPGAAGNHRATQRDRHANPAISHRCADRSWPRPDVLRPAQRPYRSPQTAGTVAAAVYLLFRDVRRHSGYSPVDRLAFPAGFRRGRRLGAVALDRPRPLSGNPAHPVFCPADDRQRHRPGALPGTRRLHHYRLRLAYSVLDDGRNWRRAAGVKPDGAA